MWYMIVIWAALVVVLLLVEFFTSDLVTIWFAIGSAVGLILAACKVDELIQVIVFAGVSLLLLFLVRPFAKKFIHLKIHSTNIDRLIGTHAVVQKGFDQDSIGEVVLSNHDLWRAITKTEEVFAEGEKVEIEEIEGVKLVVKKII